MIKRTILLAMICLVSSFISAQLGSETSHGYLYLNGNTNSYPTSQLRIVKWSNNNAHIDVMDGKSLHLNYYSGGDIYFGKATDAAHSIFKKTGQLGINTLSPYSGYNLHVNGKSLFTGLIKIGQASNVDNGSPGIVCLHNDDFLYNNEYLNHYGFGFHKFADSGQPADGRNAYVSGYFGINLFTAGANRLRISRNGNVGIGSTNPNSNLVITNNGFAGHVDWAFTVDSKTSNSASGIANFRKSNAESVMYIRGDGRVGFGTTSPNAKLDVAGNIKAHEIEVTLASIDDMQLNGTLAANNITYTANGNTADFVFEDNYQLKDLSEVEAFIKANKHLPEIPSADEMEEAGVNLAKMNKLLLMKVEELTLYAIEQKAEAERLKVEVEKEREERRAMRSEIEELRKMMLEVVSTPNP